MYLTKDAINTTLRHAAALSPGSTVAMTFILPLELADPEARHGLQMAEKGARASFYKYSTPAELEGHILFSDSASQRYSFYNALPNRGLRREAICSIEIPIGSIEMPIGTIETPIGLIESPIGAIEMSTGSIETPIGTVEMPT